MIQIKFGTDILKNWRAFDIQDECSTCTDIFTLSANEDLDDSPLADRYSTVAFQKRTRNSSGADLIEIQTDTLAEDKFICLV